MPYTENDSFTTQARVQELVNRGAYSPTTKPSQQAVLDRMALRAAEVQAVLATNGYGGTVPAGGSPIPQTTDALKNLTKLADEANAFLAAGDVLSMHDVRNDQSVLQSQAFWKEGKDILLRIAALLESGTIVLTDGLSLTRTSTSTGGVPKASFPATGEAERPRSSLFNLDTQW